MVQHSRCKQSTCKCQDKKSSMFHENKRDAACMYVHTSFDTYSDRHALGCMLLCAGVIALLCCAVLCCARGSTTTYILVHTTAVLPLLYTGTVVPPAALAHEEAWIGMPDRYILGANRRVANAKSSILQGKQTGRSMYVRT